MEKRFVAWLGFGFGVVCLLAIGIQLLRIAVDVVTTCPQRGDLATWVGAIFTGAAFAGTILIATAQKRHAESAAKSLAAVTLFSMQFRLTNLRRQLEKVAIALDAWSPGDSSRVNCQAASHAIMQYAFLNVEEVEKIIPLDEKVAHGMAAAIDFIAHCAPLLEVAHSNPKVEKDEMFKRFCGEMSQLLANAAMNLRAAAVLSARNAGRSDTQFEDNGIPAIASKKLPPRVI
ncbi:hypothetical protein [Herbaspirillum seropedicae]|uniref:hypothetical protein n=1 Tax=Herbaspirillum seropedicae TaxID=964 RepID=UPI000847E51D|nr:hypothetical protein [Herbaspirillum seropedicae]AON55451.1 hypothetical protein Hsc_3182 [Herbaspirillum seropedicae]